MCEFHYYRAWWGDVIGRRPEGTARRYRYHLHRTFADLPDDPTTVTARRLEDYISGLARSHAGSVRSALGDFFEFMVRHGYRAENPIAKIAPQPRRSRRQPKVRRAYDNEELTRLLVALIYIGEGKRRWTGQRLAWIVLAHYATGIRPGELVDLAVHNVHLNGVTSNVHVYSPKTGADYLVPLGRLGREVFAELCDDRVGKIISIGVAQYWNRIHAAALFAGLDPVKARPYAMRHTFATHMLERGAPIRVVTDLLGHVDPRTVLQYTVPPEDARRGAVDLLG
jgi:site-specific recombinase XerD